MRVKMLRWGTISCGEMENEEREGNEVIALQPVRYIQYNRQNTQESATAKEKPALDVQQQLHFQERLDQLKLRRTIRDTERAASAATAEGYDGYNAIEGPLLDQQQEQMMSESWYTDDEQPLAEQPSEEYERADEANSAIATAVMDNTTEIEEYASVIKHKESQIAQDDCTHEKFYVEIQQPEHGVTDAEEYVGDPEYYQSEDAEYYTQTSTAEHAGTLSYGSAFEREETPAQVQVFASTYVGHSGPKDKKRRRKGCCLAVKIISQLPQDLEQASQQDQHGRLAVHTAAVSGHLECLKALHALGVDLQQREHSEYQRTALFLSCSVGEYFVAEYLLESDSGAFVNTADSRGDTPLHAACYAGNSYIVQLLLKWGAGTNQTNLKGLAAAHLCSDVECLKILREYNASLAVQDKQQRTVLFHVAAKQQYDCVKFLCESPDGKATIDVADTHGDTPLHACCSSPKEEGYYCVKVLLQLGADPLRRNAHGYLPSEIAAYYSTLEVNNMLLDAEASSKAQGYGSAQVDTVRADESETADNSRETLGRSELKELAVTLGLHRNYAILAVGRSQQNK